MLQKPALKKYKERIAITVAVFFTFIAVFSFVIIAYIHRFEKELNNENMSRLSEVSDFVAENITNVIGNTIKSIESAADAIMIIESHSGRLAYLKSIAKNHSLAYIGYTDKNGILNATETSESKDISQNDYYKAAIEGNIFISDLTRKIFKNRVATGIIISIPLKSKDGVIVAMFETALLRDILYMKSFGGDGYSYIIDRQGNLIMKTKSLVFNNLFNGWKNAHFMDGGSIDKLQSDIALGIQGTTKFSNHNVEFYANYRPLSFNNWVAINVIAEKNFSAKTFMLTKELALIGSISALVFILLILATLTSYRLSKESQLATQAKTAFLANMSHEIRTPMNAIVGISEIMMRDEMSEKQRDKLARILNASKSLLTIINDILDISKVESGKFTIINTPYHIESLLYDITSIAAVRIGDKPIEFFIKVAPDLPTTFVGDGARIKQILLNIVGNAVKFTEKGFICLSVKTEKKENSLNIICEIEDTGMGIKEEDISKLFISFNQLDMIKNHNIEGTGLGLAISKKLTEMMHGDICVRSTYGKGSIFTVTLPQGLEKPDLLINPVNENYNVLIWESSKILCKYMSSCLDAHKIPNIFCETYAEFECQLSTNTFTHAFVKRNMLKQYNFGKYYNKTKIESLIGLSEYSLFDPESQNLYEPLFSLQFPAVLNTKNGNTTRTVSREESSVGSIEKMPYVSVLVVDDNEINILVAEGLMEPFGMKISHAFSGKEAIKMVKENDFDLVLMDHMMPEMDGVETVLAIRAMPEAKYKKLPIVALTANATEDAREMFMANKFNGFLAKPIDTRQLNEILIKWLKKINESRSAGGK